MQATYFILWIKRNNVKDGLLLWWNLKTSTLNFGGITTYINELNQTFTKIKLAQYISVKAMSSGTSLGRLASEKWAICSHEYDDAYLLQVSLRVSLSK